jgi:hypothetical protein
MHIPLVLLSLWYMYIAFTIAFPILSMALGVCECLRVWGKLYFFPCPAIF